MRWLLGHPPRGSAASAVRPEVRAAAHRLPAAVAGSHPVPRRRGWTGLRLSGLGRHVVAGAPGLDVSRAGVCGGVSAVGAPALGDTVSPAPPTLHHTSDRRGLGSAVPHSKIRSGIGGRRLNRKTGARGNIAESGRRQRLREPPSMRLGVGGSPKSARQGRGRWNWVLRPPALTKPITGTLPDSSARRGGRPSGVD
ncbi:hypothetical protein NDU88_004682 [Pleurodeles waltl]|uniref:Uncharacterized protein n=1 Tax=Pleurodeles waltl TaxID=8319 RepID=A0AAV7NLR7_PLEWA|nr:hypothetical protein NDU88_004682 [Pleurodeles waltl]